MNATNYRFLQHKYINMCCHVKVIAGSLLISSRYRELLPPLYTASGVR